MVDTHLVKESRPELETVKK